MTTFYCIASSARRCPLCTPQALFLPYNRTRFGAIPWASGFPSHAKPPRLTRTTRLWLIVNTQKHKQMHELLK